MKLAPKEERPHPTYNCTVCYTHLLDSEGNIDRKLGPHDRDPLEGKCLRCPKPEPGFKPPSEALKAGYLFALIPQGLGGVDLLELSKKTEPKVFQALLQFLKVKSEMAEDEMEDMDTADISSDLKREARNYGLNMG